MRKTYVEQLGKNVSLAISHQPSAISHQPSGIALGVSGELSDQVNAHRLSVVVLTIPSLNLHEVFSETSPRLFGRSVTID